MGCDIKERLWAVGGGRFHSAAGHVQVYALVWVSGRKLSALLVHRRCESGAVIPLLTGAALGPWRPLPRHVFGTANPAAPAVRN